MVNYLSPLRRCGLGKILKDKNNYLRVSSPIKMIKPLEVDVATTIKSTTSTVLATPPSCIEFSRLDPELMVVGTYSLVEQGDQSESGLQSRNGSLIVLHYSGKNL